MPATCSLLSSDLCLTGKFCVFQQIYLSYVHVATIVSDYDRGESTIPVHTTCTAKNMHFAIYMSQSCMISSSSSNSTIFPLASSTILISVFLCF